MLEGRKQLVALEEATEVEEVEAIIVVAVGANREAVDMTASTAMATGIIRHTMVSNGEAVAGAAEEAGAEAEVALTILTGTEQELSRVTSRPLPSKRSNTKLPKCPLTTGSNASKAAGQKISTSKSKSSRKKKKPRNSDCKKKRRRRHGN